MAGRPITFDIDESIRKATEVFWRKGYEAASTEDLLNAMGIGKGSFYLHFKEGKRELYQRTLELFSRSAMQRFYQKLSESQDQITFLKSFILSLADNTVEQREKGCYLGNSIVEMSTVDIKMKEYAGSLMKRLEEAFEKIITEAQNNGRIQVCTEAGILARYLINVRNGINVSMRTEANREHLRSVLELSLEVLK